MSNDKTNLADVQPGGRVRLGDELPPLPRHHSATRGSCILLYTEYQMRDYALAALSAQPSPSGQDGPAYEGHTWVSDYVLAGLRERAAMPLQLRNGEVWHWQGDGHDFPESLVCPVIMSAETLRALLAARQPVGEPVAWMIERLRGKGYGRDKYVVMKGQASSDPDSHLFWADQQARDNHRVTPLYASPAQAVDLGAVRALLQRRIEQWRSHLPADPGAPGTHEIETKGEHDYNNDVRIYREGIAVMEDVLALIDSQDSRNG